MFFKRKDKSAISHKYISHDEFMRLAEVTKDKFEEFGESLGGAHADIDELLDLSKELTLKLSALYEDRENMLKWAILTNERLARLEATLEGHL